MSFAEEPEQGAYVAVVTPFSDGGLAVDATAFAAHADWVVRQGRCGLVAFGSTGDGPWLSLEEKFACLDALGEAGLLDVTIVTITEEHPRAARELASRAAQLPAAGLLVLPPPYYGKHRQLDLRAHFASLAEAFGQPVLAYHIPKHAPPVPVDDLDDDAVAGAKDSSGDVAYTQAVRALGKTVLWGSEGAAGSALGLVDGLITASGNVVPEIAAPATRALREGADPERVLDALKALRQLTYGSERPWLLKKLATKRHGIDLGPARPPTVDDGKDVDIDELLAAARIATTLTGASRD